MNNIVLIGMPSAGKSTLGVVLAKTLGMNFIDTDLVIQQKTGRLLQKIINEDGIKDFLKIEENSILSLKVNNTVIATGGSVIFCGKAIEYLKQESIVVYLKVEFDEIVKRLDNITTRGVVLATGQNLKDMYNERAPLYEKYSDVIIDCSNKVVEEIISNVIKEEKLWEKL
ncbi:MAG: shikimate kinase [Clostridiaceae bacterium]|nr:shikimate kinase [Clostridiaceae bacterium]